MVYLITFNCYGTRLRGDERGSDDRMREGRGEPIEPSVALVNYGKRIMTHSEARLDPGESFLVLSAIRETCSFRHWTLLAAHVRSTHIHLVVDGIVEVNGAIRDFKAYASGALNGEGMRRRWARGGNGCSATSGRCAPAFAMSSTARVRRRPLHCPGFVR